MRHIFLLLHRFFFFLKRVACFFYVHLSFLKITNYPETTRSFIYGVKLFDSHCDASINMHNTLLLSNNIMHGHETLMCSLDKEALNLEKISRGVSERVSSLVEERECLY